MGRAGEVETATGAGGSAGGDRSRAKAEKRATVRLNLTLSEPSDVSSVEFNYGELIHNLQVQTLGFIQLSVGRAAGVGMLWECLCGLVMAERRVGDAPCLRWRSVVGPTGSQRRQRSSRRGWPAGCSAFASKLWPLCPTRSPGRWPLRRRGDGSSAAGSSRSTRAGTGALGCFFCFLFFFIGECLLGLCDVLESRFLFGRLLLCRWDMMRRC